MSALTCGGYRRVLSDTLDGPLAKREQEAFEAHGRACPPCFAHMKDAVVLRESMRGIVALEETEDAAAPRLPESLVQRILAAAKQTRGDAQGETRKKA